MMNEGKTRAEETTANDLIYEEQIQTRAGRGGGSTLSRGEKKTRQVRN